MKSAAVNASNRQSCDVTILGGGLAGLSLALQCRQEIPTARIKVLEKSRHPAPEAAFKVGESTVEVATYYFTKVLGLEEHMEAEQLSKLGLRFFFRAGDNSSIERRLELGGRDFPPTPSYQLDRGRLENYLAKRCQSMGIDFVDGATIKQVDLAGGRKPHQVQFVRDGVEHAVDSRWVADCSGRAAILKRKLGLEKEITHRANAAWFRVGAEIKIDEWSTDPVWRKNYDIDTNPRWLSTNHLMGDGYWVWLIPLASGCTSIGIVADENKHPLSGFNSLEKALAWLDVNEPQCAEKIRQQQEKIQDFLAIKRYSRECKQVFSSRRWGITGEAGFFLDPFYSPGSDFIGFGNTFLSALIKRDLQGQSIRMHAPLFDFLYKRMHYGTAPVYQDQYPLFGDQQIMPIKILWDYMVYWTLSGYVFCHDKTTDLSMYGRHFFKLKRLSELNQFMQKFFRLWHEQSPHWESTGEIDAWDMPVIIETNRALKDELDKAAYGARFADNVAQMETLFWEIIDHSGVECRVPFKRKQHPKSIKGSFDLLFAATQRRLDTAGQASDSSTETAAEMPVQCASEVA
jgi:flavin-dependent dehydrogenase